MAWVGFEKNRICVIQTDMKKSDAGHIGAKKNDVSRIGLQPEHSLRPLLIYYTILLYDMKLDQIRTKTRLD